jgi:hypothetical protein
VAIGGNWGYHGRMQLSGLPLAVLVTLAALHQVGLRWTPKAAGSAAAALVVGSLVVLQWVNLGYARNPGPVATITGVTPAGYWETGAAVDRVRRELGAEQLSFMTPDVGGSSLAYPRLQFVDMGLLANARLARDGYAGFDRYLADTHPDLIDAHTMWAEASGISQDAGEIVRQLGRRLAEQLEQDGDVAPGHAQVDGERGRPVVTSSADFRPIARCLERGVRLRDREPGRGPVRSRS